MSSSEEEHARAEEQDKHTNVVWLAEEILRFIQLKEALGRTPQMKEFGTSGFEYRSAVLSPDPQQAWEQYAAVVEAALESALGAPQLPASMDSMPAAIPTSPTQQVATADAPPPPRPDDHPEETERRPWRRRFLWH